MPVQKKISLFLKLSMPGSVLLNRYTIGGNYMDTVSSNDRMLAMAIYVTSFFTTLIGPLLIWLLKKEESPFIDFHGKEYLNFIISYSVYSIVASILMLVLIGFILLPIIGLMAFIFTIIAAVKAYNGEIYHFPLVFRIIK